jgi:hypothetical protein
LSHVEAPGHRQQKQRKLSLHAKNPHGTLEVVLKIKYCAEAPEIQFDARNKPNENGAFAKHQVSLHCLSGPASKLSGILSDVP